MDTDLSFTLARSFSAASLEERFKYIDLWDFVRLGDPGLLPESAYSADLAMSSAPLRVGPTQFRIYAGIENLTDQSYTNHLSTNRGSISIEPGRNYYLCLSLSF